jgi:hypothetical protein
MKLSKGLNFESRKRADFVVFGKLNEKSRRQRGRKPNGAKVQRH